MGLFSGIEKVWHHALDNQKINVAKRQDAKTQRSLGRSETRGDQTFYRQEGRTLRQGNRMDSHMVAYQNGIDPYASRAGAISDSMGSVSGMFSSIYGFGSSPGQSGPGGGASSLTGIEPLLLVAAALACVYFFFFRKKSKKSNAS